MCFLKYWPKNQEFNFCGLIHLKCYIMTFNHVNLHNADRLFLVHVSTFVRIKKEQPNKFKKEDRRVKKNS